jgi:hypothetical protein
MKLDGSIKEVKQQTVELTEQKIEFVRMKQDNTQKLILMKDEFQFQIQDQAGEIEMLKEENSDVWDKNNKT